MNPIKTFPRGGVHPEENKLSANQPIQDFPMPMHIIVPLGQCLGAPADCIVKKGDRVLTGQLIGTATGFVSANVHSPATGTVAKVDVVMDHTGYYKPAVFIDREEQDEWVEGVIQTDELLTEIKLDSKQIIDRVKDCGIVGMGGATFPTHVKLMVPEGKKAEYIIINAAECEPYLTCDFRLLLEKTQEFLVGVKILMKAVNTDKGIIGIEENKMEAIELLEKTINAHRDLYKGIEVQPLKTKYPQGGEKQIIKAITGREVPSGKLPIETGCVVVNVASTYAIYEAVQKNKPLIERIVTVTGKSVKKPCNLCVRFGTPANLLIEAAGGLPENITDVINGGPMMGKSVSVTDFPCMKGTSGILLMTLDEAQDRRQTNCIRCGRCAKACPMGLQPFLLHKVAKLNDFDETEANHIMDCIECGSCEFTCPANIPLLDYIRYGKAKTGAIIRARNQK